MSNATASLRDLPEVATVDGVTVLVAPSRVSVSQDDLSQLVGLVERAMLGGPATPTGAEMATYARLRQIVRKGG